MEMIIGQRDLDDDSSVGMEEEGSTAVVIPARGEPMVVGGDHLNDLSKISLVQ